MRQEKTNLSKVKKVMIKHNKKIQFFALLCLLLSGFFSNSVLAQQSTNSISSNSSSALQSSLVSNNGIGGLAGIPAIKMKPQPDGTQEYSVTLQILGIMTVLSLLPTLLMMMTSFTRIIVTLAILRQAIGLQNTPSSQIMLGLALFLTLFIMMPVFNEANEKALQPYMAEQMTSVQAIEEAVKPFHKFMVAQTRENDLDLFMRISNTEPVANLEDIPFTVLAPAFLTSELKTAFQIGFILFIPFLVIDLVVASVLMAMGMMMLSPVIISLPFKVMLFVMVDGWAMIVGTLASSYL